LRENRLAVKVSNRQPGRSSRVSGSVGLSNFGKNEKTARPCERAAQEENSQ